MGQDENIWPTDSRPYEGEQVLFVLRGIWSARQQTSVQIDEACNNTKSCKSMANVGFQWLVDDVEVR